MAGGEREKEGKEGGSVESRVFEHVIIEADGIG